MAVSKRLKTAAITFWKRQKMRISEYNRIVSVEYIKELLEKETDEKIIKAFKKDPDEAAKKYRAEKIEQMMDEFALVRDEIDTVIRRGREDVDRVISEKCNLISDYANYTLIKGCVNSLDTENQLEKTIKYYVEQEQLWKRYLCQIKGIGPIIAACLMVYIDIEKARHISSLWKYCGLDVVQNPTTGEWEGRSKKKDHLVKRKYINKDGEEEEKNSITYNDFLKSKVVFVLGRSLILHPGPYRTIYDNIRHRYENDPKHADKSKKHIFYMARRYTVKIFLKDLWLAWRQLEGLPTEGDYWEDKIAHRPHGGADAYVPAYQLLP